MTAASPILEPLNPRQREAVEHTEGPLLIIAGPGSGKTRVIAHRVAYLIREKGVRPRRVLAVTFTNKAAREMRERVRGLVGEAVEGDITMGTFHGICSRILRIDGDAIGVPNTYTIYDHSDQVAAVKQALDDLGIDPRRNPPRGVLSAISRAKSELQGPRQFAALVADYFQEVTSRVFLRYQDILEQNDALDFDDLLVKTAELFQERDDVLEKYAERYLYVHVDEFQDTNIVQYVLAKQWASRHGNICVVGDPDQSIYSWRSADIRNILNFEHDYPDARIVVLDQNYRSTQSILDSAHAVIALNKQRKEKNLWTDNDAGRPLTVHEAFDEEDEARFVAEEIERLKKDERLPHQGVAVMYRTNAQSRPLEETLIRRNIPYRLVGGTRFYERREVKDLIAYLRLLQNPFDSVALLRIINVPTRGIGNRTIQALTRWARERGLPPYAALQMLADEERDSPNKEAGGGDSSFQKRTAGALLRFLGLLNEMIEKAKRQSLSTLLDDLIDAIEYRSYIMADPDGEERWENVQELRAVASQYDELDPQHALASFLEDVALITDVDEYDETVDAVTLITLHAAKGLEFPAVFIVGVEEGMLPHMRSIESGSNEQLEEERRLFYVGMTRAKQHLYLVRAYSRSFGGHRLPSRFLQNIPSELVAMTQRAHEPRLFRTRERLSAISAGASFQLAHAEEPAPVEAFRSGEHVRHPKFGEGVVVSCQPSGGDYQIVIAFKGEAGIKKLLLSFAPLERVEA